MLFRGWQCRQEICIGSLFDEILKDPHTSVCIADQVFYFVNERDKTDWINFFGSNKNMLNSICGLGKEPASRDSISFVSYAYYHGYIDKLVYSFELAPSLAEQSATNAIRALKQGTEDDIDEDTIVNKIQYKYTTVE